MKKIALFKRAMLIIGILLGMGAANALVMFALTMRGETLAGPLKLIWPAEICIYIIIAIVVYYHLIRPLRDIRKICQRFVNGQTFDEFFEVEDELIPGWGEVLQQIRHLVNKQDAIRMSKKQAEYLALQNQINPHFLYNTLEAIRGDAICAGLNSVAETAEALSVFFRYSITGVDRLVSLEEEIDNVENYFTIQYNRFGDKLKLKITYPHNEEIMQYRIPKLTIQPFVENAIFHGLEKKIEGGTVRVNLDTTLNKLLITISDNGVGIPEEQVEKINGYFDRIAVSYVGEDNKKQGGIAMKNVNSRIKLLFGEDYGVHVYSVEQMGTDVMITLPKLRKGEYEEGTIAD